MPTLSTRMIKDHSVRRALQRALRGDGALSYRDVRGILRSTLDGDGITWQEYNDLQTILRNSRTMDVRSRRLVKHFIDRRYKPVVKTKPASSEQLEKNFNLSEFACKDGTAVPAELVKNVKSLASNLQVLREKLGKPIKINSAFRTKSHNKAVGGAKNSQHLVAKAADIVVSRTVPADVKKAIEALIKDGKMTQGGDRFVP